MRVLVVVAALIACSRDEVAAKSEPVGRLPKLSAEPVVAKIKPVPSEEPPTPSAPPPKAEPPTETPKPKLVPFLTVVPPTIPPGAYDKPAAPYSNTYAPKGFNPLTAKDGKVTHLAGGNDLLGFTFSDGASDSKGYIAIANGGKVKHTFDYVIDFALDTTRSILVLNHARPDPSGKRVYAREILDVAAGSWSPLPNVPCAETFSFLSDGRILARGVAYENAWTPHAWICVFDSVGKLMVQIDAGLHNHHAASSSFINWTASTLSKEPNVLWATREYESYGNYDITFVDLNPPHARKYARLNTPNTQLSSPGNLQIDLAETTMAATEVRFRGKSSEGWWWKWQTANLKSDP